MQTDIRIATTEKNRSFTIAMDTVEPGGRNILSESWPNEIDLAEFLGGAADQTVFLNRINTIVHRAGFSDYSYLLIESQCDPGEYTGTYPEKIRRQYLEEKLNRYDLAIAHAMLSDTPIFQADIKATIDRVAFTNMAFSRNRLICELRERYGFNDVYCLAFDSCSGRGRAVFSIANRRQSPEGFQHHVTKCADQIAQLARAVDELGNRQFADAFPPEKRVVKKVINDKPLALLRILVAHDVTLNEAALMLNISISTANQQIAAAKQALGVNTTSGAIIQAIKLGLIRVDEPD